MKNPCTCRSLKHLQETQTLIYVRQQYLLSFEELIKLQPVFPNNLSQVLFDERQL